MKFKLIAHALYSRHTDAPQYTQLHIEVENISSINIKTALEKEAQTWTGKGVISVTSFTKKGCGLSSEDQNKLDGLEHFIIPFDN